MPALIFAQKLAGSAGPRTLIGRDSICAGIAEPCGLDVDWNQVLLPGMMRKDGISDVNYHNLPLSVA